MASRHAVGESLRMSNTSGSAYPGIHDTCRSFRIQRILGSAFALILVHEHKP